MPAPAAAGAIGRACCAVGAGTPERWSGALCMLGATPAGGGDVGPVDEAGGIDCGPVCAAGGGGPVDREQLAAVPAQPVGQRAVRLVQQVGRAARWHLSGGGGDRRNWTLRWLARAAARLVDREQQAAVLVQPVGQRAVRLVQQAVALAPERRAAA